MLMSAILNKRNNFTQASELGLMQTNDVVGVEIEVEGMRERQVPRWNVVREESIDNGIEFVLSQPLSGVDLTNALYDVEDAITSGGGRFSECTSVHIHMNILDMTLVQLTNYLTLLVMLEKVLYNYVDRSRTSNHFCWAFGDCEDLVRVVAEVYESRQSDRETVREKIRRRWNADACKYAGINLSAVPRYGSLELRMHHGTSDAVGLIRWINILQSIKRYAMADGRTPSNILDHKMSNGIPSIFRDILGEQYSLLLSYEGLEQDILYGIRLAQDFVYTLNRLERDRNPHGLVPDDLSSDLMGRLLQTTRRDGLTAAGESYAA